MPSVRSKTTATVSTRRFSSARVIGVVENSYPVRHSIAKSPGYETGLCFAPPHEELIKVARTAQERSQVDGNRVLRPFMPDTISGE